MGTPTSPAPLCFMCKRYRDSYRCDAFPEGIPFDVISSQVDHRSALADDGGKRFIPVTPAAKRYAEDLFPGTPSIREVRVVPRKIQAAL